jgi:hypothetical protein
LASIAIELDRERFRKLRGETETEFVRNLKCLVDSSFEHESEKKSRRARGLGSDSGLNLAISRFTNSLVVNTPLTPEDHCQMSLVSKKTIRWVNQLQRPYRKL